MRHVSCIFLLEWSTNSQRLWVYRISVPYAQKDPSSLFEMRRGQPQEFWSLVSTIDGSRQPQDCVEDLLCRTQRNWYNIQKKKKYCLLCVSYIRTYKFTRYLRNYLVTCLLCLTFPILKFPLPAMFYHTNVKVMLKLCISQQPLPFLLFNVSQHAQLLLTYV